MREESLGESARAISQQARRAGLTQKEIAEAVSANQSQVSRVLSGKLVRRSRLYDEICIYVNNAVRGVSAEAVRENDELIDALAGVWDGTAQHATALATVIRSLAGLSPPDRRHRTTPHQSGKEAGQC